MPKPKKKLSEDDALAPTPLQTEVIGRLAKAMKEAKVSQRELSRLSGVAQSTISLILRGEMVPGIDHLTRMESALGLDYAFLLVGAVRPGSKPRAARMLGVTRVETFLREHPEIPNGVAHELDDWVRDSEIGQSLGFDDEFLEAASRFLSEQLARAKAKNVPRK